MLQEIEEQKFAESSLSSNLGLTNLAYVIAKLLWKLIDAIYALGHWRALKPKAFDANLTNLAHVIAQLRSPYN